MLKCFLRCPLDFDNGAWTFGRKQEEYKFPNSTTTRSVVRRRVFRILKYIHKYICGIPDIPSIPYIPGRVWFAFSPLPDHVHYLPNHHYHLPDHVHHISHINTNILLGICWYPWYQIYLDVRSLFFYTNILLLAEIFTYAILCLGAHFPFESGYSGGEGAQCRKWLGCPEESMRGVTLTGGGFLLQVLFLINSQKSWI